MSSLKVAVRVRPFNQRELDMDAKLIVQMDSKKTKISKPTLSAIRDSLRENFSEFTFDYSYWSYDSEDNNYATQEQVYEDLGTDVINCAFQGYNACVFAYGQTGSGKTFTMMGSPEMQGLIPRICKSLFARMKLGQEAGTGYKTHVSYLEIYNERVKDLLGPQTIGHGLRVREHRTLGPYVENLSQHPVDDYTEIQECISKGNVLRTTASTNMNDTSSRSHAIFTITFVQAGYMNEMPSETVSKIHLVDLAGSERANATGATGQRLKEGAHINKSLVTLGSVISALAEQTNPTYTNKRPLYIPYRDSTLTWLLKDSLGGNSKTIMIAAISPADCNYSETLSTLRYANRAKNIINKPTINEDPNVKLIRELREEITKLKSMMANENDTLEPALKMLEDLQKKEAQEKVLTDKWTEKWREAQIILREQKSLGLRKSGFGVVLDSEVPHLIGIHDDVSTGVTLYSLKEGETSIGTDDADIPQDIVLTGVGIYPEHCSIVLQSGNVMIYPKPPGQCWLNANLIEEPIAISQGDILLLGRTNMFRFNNPTEAAKLRKDPSRSRLDLSRLSWIAASRENLNSNFHLEEDVFHSSPSKREKAYYPSDMICRDDLELQDENKRILQTIENALKQLNMERSLLHEQYKSKVKILSAELHKVESTQKSKLEILECREKELLARKEMLLWERNTQQVQVDIISRQLSALETQLDSKKRDFFEYVAKELQELQDCGKLDELDTNLSDRIALLEDSSEILLQVSSSLDNFSVQFIKDTVRKSKSDIENLEKELTIKKASLNDSAFRVHDLNSRLEQLELENRELQRSRAENETLDNKKHNLTLNLKAATETGSENGTLTTCETFHTANSDCSQLSLSPATFLASSQSRETLISFNPVMSDSGVSLDTNKISKRSDVCATSPKSTNIRDTKFDEDCDSCKSTESHNGLSEMANMHILRQKIAALKAQIMKYLEMNCDKAELDERIAELQELQKCFVKFEMEMQTSGKAIERSDGCMSESDPLLDIPESIVDSDDSRRQRMDTISVTPSSRNGYDPSSYSAASMTRSMPSIAPYHDSDCVLSIPNYIMRGAGKQTHYEYEVRITLCDEKWTLLRRYSRFRELHLSMKNCYGEKISAISFPRRELFTKNSESVAKNRRRQLEAYVRRLLVVCAKIPQCPIYEGAGGLGLTKQTLVEFSPFFKKGLFESGKHGTG